MKRPNDEDRRIAGRIAKLLESREPLSIPHEIAEILCEEREKREDVAVDICDEYGDPYDSCRCDGCCERRDSEERKRDSVAEGLQAERTRQIEAFVGTVASLMLPDEIDASIVADDSIDTLRGLIVEARQLRNAAPNEAQATGGSGS